VLQVVSDDTDQSHAEGHRRIPRLVDYAIQIVVIGGPEMLEGVRVDGVVVAGEQIDRRQPDLRHLGAVLAVSGRAVVER